MKRKVQAQRKFAQGAYIPQSSNMSLERRLEVTPAKEDHRAIFHNKTSANNLLDIVSFQNMHSHMQPVVLLERIKKPSSSDRDSVSALDRLNETNHTSAFPNDLICAVTSNHRITRFSPSGQKLNKRKRKVTPVANESPVTRKGLKRKGTGFSIDDNKPLKYFMRTREPKSEEQTLSQSRTDSEEHEKVHEGRPSQEHEAKTPSPESSMRRRPVMPSVDTSGYIADPVPNTVNQSTATMDYPSPKITMIDKKHSQVITRKHVAYRNEQIERWLSESVHSQRPQRIQPPQVTFKVPQTIPIKSEQLDDTFDLPTSSCDPQIIDKWITPETLDGLSQFASVVLEKLPLSKGVSELYPPSLPIELTWGDTNEDMILPVQNSMAQAITEPEHQLEKPSTLLVEPTVPQIDHDRWCIGNCSSCRGLPKPEPLASNINQTDTITPTDVYEFINDSEVISDMRALRSVSRQRSRDHSPPRNVNVYGGSQRYLNLAGARSSINKNELKSFTDNSNHAEHRWRSEAMEMKEVTDMNHADLPGQLITNIANTHVTEPPLLEAAQSKEQAVASPMPAQQTTEPTAALEPNNSHTSTNSGVPAQQIIPPTFYPTEAEFTDPIAYFEKIMPDAAKFGVVKVVAPPSFKPSCHVGDDIRFNVCNQYLGRMYCRWSPAAKELCAIKAYVASQGVNFTRSPLVDGLEINLPKLYHLVQRHGGLKKVIQKKRWSRIAEEMHLTKRPNPVKKLDQVYVKYLLPYDTMTKEERKDMIQRVEKAWSSKNQRMLERAMNPLHRQRRLLGESDSSEDEPEDESHVGAALAEAEDCVVSGRNMKLATFKKIATHAMDTYFPESGPPSMEELEMEYWRLVLLGTEHVCVNAASIDTGEEGYGFTKRISDPYARHPWNLKMISQNSGNVLRSLGPVLGVTVPTLHLGMVFSTSCWHRDPHGLPWVEYMHSGPGKLWYGIPNEESDKFCKAVEKLCPTSRQNKSIWLPSDIAMIPPKLLLEQQVSISKVEQLPGEFVIVFPKAYSSSVSRGYTHSESVYFATHDWLSSVHQIFQGLRESCEPTMFALEQLLIAISRDERVPLKVLQQVHANLNPIVLAELEHRRQLLQKRVFAVDAQSRMRPNNRKRPAGAWNVRDQDECEICRTTLYLSKVVGLAEKNSSVCLQHALRLLNMKNMGKAQDCELITFFSERELKNLLKKLRAGLSNSAT